ncbi:MAG: hypothetical protein AABY22_26325, partial [Nanoarchaeota archaeon]
SDPVWKKINLPTRTLKTISIIVPKDTVDSTEFVLNELKNLSELDKATVKVDISLSSPDLKPIVKSDIEKYLTTQGVFNVTSISQTKKSVVIKKNSNNTMTTKMDVPAAINAYADVHVDAKIKSAFIELSLEIFNQYKAEAKE